MQRLQRVAGNRAAVRLLARPAVQRVETRAAAESDAKFAVVAAEVEGKQGTAKAHPPPGTEAAAAAAAATPPQDDKEAQGKTANAEKMNAAKPGEFDKAAFVRAVNEAIAAQAPKNLDEADKFADSGKADAVKGQVQGQVTQGKQQSAEQIETTTKAPPDTGAAQEKPVTPLAPDRPPPTPAPPNAANAVPDKAPAAATDFSAGPAEVDQQMARAEVTEDQLARSNEPEFADALREKKSAEAHAATAPGQVRAAEAQTLAGTKNNAARAGATAMTAFAGDRTKAGAQVTAGKQGAKSEDEARRVQVTTTLQKVFDATKSDVEKILGELDKKVEDRFTAGEKAVRDAFTAEHKRKMDDYKDKRYSGPLGPARWIKDKVAGMPAEVNRFFDAARQNYVTGVQRVISEVADLIGGELNRAKARIGVGRAELRTAVDSLAPELRAIGKRAADEFSGRFDELTESVDAKGDALVQTLAAKYNDALKSVDEEIAAEKDKNKGLVAKAVDAVKGVIDTILKLKDLLLGILAKAAAVIGAILRDPIGFLGNLVSAVGAGLRGFVANIGEHLKRGLVGWLFGAMPAAGLPVPARFDSPGIITMIATLLGLTWATIRARVLRRGVPERAMDAVEAAVPEAARLRSEGVGPVVRDAVGDIKGALFGKIAEYLVPTVLVAGITLIISLLNPASAFIRAIKMIIDFVRFLIDNAAQVMAFVNSVLDAVIAIAGGGGGGVPLLVENALAAGIPLLIGALAALLNLGGVTARVKSIVQSLSKPVTKAVDLVIDKIVAASRAVLAKTRRGSPEPGKRHETAGPGKPAPAGPGKRRPGPGQRRDPARRGKPGADRARGADAREQAAIADATRALARSDSRDQIADRLPAIERKHRVPLHLVTDAKTLDSELLHVQTARTAPKRMRATAAERAAKEQRREDRFPRYLFAFGSKFLGKALLEWWRHQLSRTTIWSDESVLRGSADHGTKVLRDAGYQKALYAKYVAGRKVRPDKPTIWREKIFVGSSDTRTDFLTGVGKASEDKIRTDVTEHTRGKGGKDYTTLAFDVTKGHYGKYLPLPGSTPPPDVDLENAVRSHPDGVIGFLRSMARGGTVMKIDYDRFKTLWDTHPGSRAWLKGEYRGANEGMHEWIPTNYIGEVLEVAVRSRKDLQHGTLIADDWVTLQHELRSYTCHVIWEITPSNTVKRYGKESIHVHAGAFSNKGKNIYNGRDGIWHNSLRGHFLKFVKNHPKGTPAEFVGVMHSLLVDGKLMWDGKIDSFAPELWEIEIDATYKEIEVTGVGDPQVTVRRHDNITLRKLSEIHTANYAQVDTDFLTAYTKLIVK
ncbi:hypothetical protein [Actinokineospora terrae]|uniref:Uncharacterized protein n=1 Tax=Actinokineospora terrae TaxID=155974 RepID=A0A1H9K4V8_9PSEU|nr:hypothetical protein [Actinokineospora terrae]SEQ94276.1 hypothetical protein SAMN04487818_10133 [Actinokineospora terrae]